MSTKMALYISPISLPVIDTNYSERIRGVPGIVTTNAMISSSERFPKGTILTLLWLKQ
jgi:hypothetical protein